MNAVHQPPMIGYAALDDFHTQSFTRRVGSLALRWLMWSGSGIVLFTVFVGLFQLFMLGVLTGVLGLIACVICTTIAAECLRSARRERAMTILNYCEQGVRLSMPLPDFLAAVASNETPRMARRLGAIVDTLEAPAPLGGALRSELPELPSRMGEVLRLAEGNGTLAAALTRLVEEERSRRPAIDTGGPMPLAYLGIVGAGILVPALMISIFVVPKLQYIFRDFGIPAPAFWNVLIGLDWRVALTLIFGVAFTTLALIIGVLARNARFMYFRRLEFDRPLKPIGDRILWYTALVGWQIRDRDWADVCQAIADGLEQHRPFDVLLREAASPHLNNVTYTRVEGWHSEMVRGAPLATAARAAKIPTLIVGLINNASGEALAPTFAFLARHYRARAVQRGAWISAALMPAITLVCGAAVTAFALMLWVPLCRLIDGCLPYPVGM